PSQIVIVAFSVTAPPAPELYTLSLHDALPICGALLGDVVRARRVDAPQAAEDGSHRQVRRPVEPFAHRREESPGALKTYWQGQADRKSTRLNSSHRTISYAVFCLKKKKKKKTT